MAPPAAVAASPGLRLLVFGPPGSGKSSLLGALAQADAGKTPGLKGDLTDPTGKLAPLRAGTYEGKPAETSEEVVAYPVHFKPRGKPAVAATLLDCDGRKAEQYLSGKLSLETDRPLARAMLEADTVILTADGSLTGDAQNEQLGKLRTFLDLLEEVRGQRADVADLPVYLVLTKSDELAAAGESTAQWMERVEDAKEAVGTQFRDYLAGGEEGPVFGRVDLNLWATAVKHPKQAGAAGAREPFGVAELFSQCLASAEEYQARRHGAGSRLGLVVAALSALVVLAGVLGVVFLTSRPDPDALRLHDQVRIALPNPAAPAPDRLRGDLGNRLKQLRAIEEDPAFHKVPDRTRAEVRQAREEMAAYLQANEQFQEVVKKPYLAKDEAEFRKQEKAVAAFELPPGRAEAWAETRLALRLGQLREEYAAVNRAIAAEEAWTRERAKEGKVLYRQGLALLSALEERKAKPSDAERWQESLREYLKPRYRAPRDERLPGVTGMTHDELARFDAVRKARHEWDAVKDELSEVSKLVESQLKRG